MVFFAKLPLKLWFPGLRRMSYENAYHQHSVDPVFCFPNQLSSSGKDEDPLDALDFEIPMNLKGKIQN